MDRFNMPLIQRYSVPGILVVCLIYILGFAFEFTLDPLGRSPVLDARENLDLVERLHGQSYPDEPFYRAMLYPYLLSLLPFSVSSLPLVALLLGVLAHCLNAILVGRISAHVWQTQPSAWCAGVLYAAYPVAIYFSVQVLDITLGISFFLLSVDSLFTERKRWYLGFLLAGLCGSLAVLIRPNFLPAVLLLPVLALGLGVFESRKAGLPRAAIASVLVCVTLCAGLLAQGVVNHLRSGEFRVLPWQGAYNLYAANNASANGKYLAQQVAFDSVPVGMNPTRMESEYRYLEAHGADAELDIGEMSAYWRGQLRAEIQEDPMRWVGLMGKKLLYLLNDWEQYNNLSYEYHQSRFIALQYNPLGWGLLSLFAAASLWIARGRILHPRVLVVLALIAAYACGVLMFFVSARFRLPLVPLLCVLAGGLACVNLRQIRELGAGRQLVVMAAALFICIVAYANWFHVRDTSTFIQDEVMLASASARLGDDDAAMGWADAALLRDPANAEAQRVRISSLFNLWMQERHMAAGAERFSALEQSLAGLTVHDATTTFIKGVCLWLGGQHEGATNVWNAAVVQYRNEAAFSARALQAVGAAKFFPEEDAGVVSLKALLLSRE